MGQMIETGFVEISAFGDMAGKPFDPKSSGNLIITARKRGG